MTHDTADDFSPESLEPVTVEQLATEPAPGALHMLRLSAVGYDALAHRIEAAAAAELARRRAERPVFAAPRLIVTSGGQARRRGSMDSDLAPLLARALRPALLAAAAAGLFAVGLSQRSGTANDTTGQQLSDASAVQALSLHDPSAQWVDQARAPTVDALGRAIGLGGAP